LVSFQGLFPHWRSLDPSQAVKNCENAMNLAQSQFGVPKVLEPEYLASPWLDELSGMTYLSYFMKEDGPGYKASLRWVNTQVRNPVRNFTVSKIGNYLYFGFWFMKAECQISMIV
jgi:filamin